MQHDTDLPADDRLDDAFLEDGTATLEPAAFDLAAPGGVAVAPAGAAAPALRRRWRPPTQEVALDPELVAILCGEVASADGDDGEAAPERAETEDDASDAESESDAGSASDDAGGDEPEPEALVRPAAALLLASPEALTSRRLGELLGVRTAAVPAVLEALARRFESADLPFVVRELAGGWRLFTDPAVADVVQRLDTSRKVEKISPAALETLAIVAYRQPVTKAEIEAIRGVQAGPMMRTLVDRRLVRVVGRADQPGSPLLYGTTQEFLDRFGLASLDELPRDGELARD